MNHEYDKNKNKDSIEFENQFVKEALEVTSYMIKLKSQMSRKLFVIVLDKILYYYDIKPE